MRAEARRAAALGLSLALLAAAATDAHARAAHSAGAAVLLTGHVGGPAGASKSTSLSVEAISMNDGSVAATSTPKRGRYALLVPRGAYLLVLSVVDLRSSRRGSQTISSPVRATAPGAHRDIKLARGTRSGTGALAVGAIPIEVAPGGRLPSSSSSEAQGAIIDGLLPGCRASSRKVLDRASATLRAIEGQQQRSDEGRAPIRTHFRAPAAELALEGRIEIQPGGTRAANLTVRNLVTAAVVDHIVAAGTEHEDIGRFLHRAGAAIGARDCARTSVPSSGPSSPATVGSLAPGHVRWEGSYRIQLSRPLQSYEESGRWLIEGAFNDRGEARPARTLRLSGGRDYENASECGLASFHTSWAPDPGDTRIPWGLSVTSQYPAAGWKYVFPASPSTIPYQERRQCGGEHLLPREQLSVYDLMTQYPPAAERERAEAGLLSPLEVEPGQTRGETRTFKFEGVKAGCTLDCPQVSAEMTLSISVDATR